MLTELEIQALLKGIGAYIGLFILLAVLGTLIASAVPTFLSSPLFSIGLSASGMVMLFVGGWVAGRAAGHRGALHGFAVGFVGALAIAAVPLLIGLEDVAMELLQAYLLLGIVTNTVSGLAGASMRSNGSV